MSCEKKLMSHSASSQSFEENKDVVVIPIVQSTIQNVQGYLVDQDAQHSLLNESPFFVAQSRENKNKRINQNYSFAGGTFYAKILGSDLFEVGELF